MNQQPHLTGRLILIADEIGPGAYALDIASTLHAAKVAVIGLTLFRQASACVDDDQQRREILDKFRDIAEIVTGAKSPPSSSIFPSEPEAPDAL